MQSMTEASSSAAPTIDLQAIKDATAELAATCQALEQQRLLRQSNLNPERPSEEALKKLDSSVKRNTALIKKLRQVTEENRDSIADELAKVNQSKYVSEAVMAVAEAQLRLMDAPAALHVCCLLHQRYAEFAAQLSAVLSKGLTAKGATPEEERAMLKRRRGPLRLLTELMLVGVVGAPQPLLDVVQDLTSISFRRDREAALNNLSLLVHFAKPAREQVLGLPPQLPQLAPNLLSQDMSSLPADVQSALAELQQQQSVLQQELQLRYVLPEAEQALFVKAVDRMYESSCAALLEDHKALREQEQENMRIVNNRGDLPADVAAKYEERRKAYEALHRAVAALAESLGRPMPELVEDAFTRLGAGDSGAAQQAAVQQADGTPQPVFEDQETKAFYESLPDLRSLVPAVLLGLGSEADAAAEPKQQQQQQQPAAAAAGSDEAAAASASTASGQEGAVPAEPAAAAAAAAAGAGADGAAAAAEEPSAASQLELLLAKLPVCVSRDLCDEVAVNFCYCNSKGARRRLMRALCDIPRASLQLVPFYARIAATLSQVFPDISAGVVSYLEEEFASLLARKDPASITLEPRIRNARYLAELAKFRLYPPGSFFVNLKQLLDDFNHLNIDAACALVETAGRFLIRTPETRTRMENMLEVMMRLKNVKNLDPRRCAQVDNAYFAVKPPLGAAARRKRRPPLQEYIRHLVRVQLNESSIVEVLKKLIKVPWAQSEPYILKCMGKVVRGRVTNIPLVVALAGGLAQYHESLGIAFVDQVLEDIRWGLENPALGTYQKRLADVKLLGELYNYMLCNSLPIFDTLYLLIMFGHETAELAQRLDPPDDYFRIRLACSLLDTCGMYFNEGRAATKLERFLTFFQAYCLSKQPMPLDVEFDVQDVLHQLRPKLQRFSTYEEAMEAVSEIMSKEANVNSIMGVVEEEEDEEEERRLGGRKQSAPSDDDNVSDGEASAASLGGDSSEDGLAREEEARRAEVDEDFEREYVQLMFETQGKVPGRGVLPTGAVLQPGRAASSSAAAAAAAADSAEGGAAAVAASGDSVAFKMLVKKGGKDGKVKELQIPAEVALAVNLRQLEDAEARERNEMKRLVLAANQSQEAEQAAALRASMFNYSSGRKQQGGGGRGEGGGRHQQGGGGGSGRGEGGRKGSGSGPQQQQYTNRGPRLGSGNYL